MIGSVTAAVCGCRMLAVSVLDPASLLETWGSLGLFAIVFIESGLLIGFFLPGDSLLFTAGLLAADGRLDIWVIAVGCAVAAVAGDQLGYTIGRRMGPVLLARPNWIVTAERVERAETFFARRGGRAVLIARFVPVVRTFTPVVAGAARMPYWDFTRWNVIGGVLWGTGVTVAGFSLGSAVPDIERYLLPIVAVIVLVSVLPAAWEMRRPALEGQRSDRA